METRLSSIAGRESRAFPRPNITNASYVPACHRSLLVRLSAPADIRRSKLTASPCTNTRGMGYPYHAPIEAHPVRVDQIALTAFIPSVPISGSGNKLPDSGHQYGFPAKRLSVEQQAERLKVSCLVNQDQESVRVQETQLPIKPEPLPMLLTMSHNYHSHLRVVRRSMM